MKLNYRELEVRSYLGGALCAGAGLLALALVLILGIGKGLRLGESGPTHSTASTPQTNSASPAQLSALGHLPMVFEPNLGQTDSQVKFLAHGSGYGLFLTAQEAVLTLQHPATDHKRVSNEVSVLRMALAGANSNPSLTGADSLPGKSNYIIGNNPARWHRNIPQFARVRYEQVYPGIDLAYYGNRGSLEYDFEVAPGADLKQIALKFQGPDSVTIDANGDLVLSAKAGDIRLQAPRVYQAYGTERRVVPGRFIRQGGDEIGFEVANYDRSRTLVIDPVLTYSTYLGGTGNEGCLAVTAVTTPGCPAVAVDTAFNLYIAGTTTSTDFPTVGTPFQGILKGVANVFIAKFNSAGNTELVATYLGGSGTDTPVGIAVDAASQIYVAGTTTSGDFPVTANAFQSTPVSVGTHVFATELKSDVTFPLLYSTYLSGDGTDTASGLALDFHAKMYLTGTTNSTNFPTTATAFQLTPKATNQFFFTKLDPLATTSAATLAYSSYLGGAVPSTGTVSGGGITVDQANSNVFLTGGTTFTDMGLNSPQAQAGGIDAFVARFDITQAGAAQEKYLAYIGGAGDDIGFGVAVDTSLNSYVTGSTTSTDILTRTYDPPLPVTLIADTFQATNLGGNDAFVMKSTTPCTGTTCTSTNLPFTYFSYLGGSADDFGYAVGVDSLQGARITGSTASSDFHLASPSQAVFGGGPTDAFVARIDTLATVSTSTSHFSTFLGGSGSDSGTGIALDSQGNTYVGGQTNSTNFPTMNPFQGSLAGGSDAFITKLGSTVNVSLTATATPSPVGVGNQVTFVYTITNNGDITSGITFTDILATSGSTLVGTPTASPGTCGAAISGTVQCNIGTLNAAQIATVTVIVVPQVGPTVGNSGQVTIAGSSFTASASASAVVNDFTFTPPPSPASFTVTAGQPATYQVTIAPTATPFPNSVTLSCSAGLPTGALCDFTNGGTIPNLNSGPVSRTLNISTTVRPVTTSSVWHAGAFYAAWLPVSGLAFLGIGIGGKNSRRRRVLSALLVSGFLSLILFQAGCGSSTSTPILSTGTPAGTYTITITATSGTQPHSASVQLVVK